MTNNLIITCAVVGAELSRDIYPHLPLSPDEIANSAEEAVKAGASIIHLHVRDENGLPTQNVDVFEEVTDKIKKRCDCIIQYSTGGAVGTPLSARSDPLRLKPEMATLSMGTMNFGADIYENSLNTIEHLANTMMKQSIMPEVEIFDCGMMDTLERMLGKGMIPKKHHVDFVLGVPGGMAATIKNLIFLTDRLSKDQAWTVTGLGKAHLPITMHAIAMGGHVRSGIEDTIYYSKGELALSNAQLVKRISRIAEEMGRPVASVGKAREQLGL